MFMLKNRMFLRKFGNILNSRLRVGMLHKLLKLLIAHYYPNEAETDATQALILYGLNTCCLAAFLSTSI